MMQSIQKSIHKVHYERPGHDLDKLKTKIHLAIWEKFIKRGGKVDVAFRSKNLNIDEDVENFLVTRIIMEEFVPDIVKVKHRNHSRTIFITQFKKNRGKIEC